MKYRVGLGAVAMAALMALPMAASAQLYLPNRSALAALQSSLNNQALQDEQDAQTWAAQHNVPVQFENTPGHLIRLVGFRYGRPLYRGVTNLEADTTVGTNLLWPSASTGLNLTGAGITLGVWDGGHVDGSHKELTGRVTYGDLSSLYDHATAVAGTMAATGIDANAQGAANQASILSYDWNNDEGEMASAQASGIAASNHSYVFEAGWVPNLLGDGVWGWLGDPTISQTTDWEFGFYSYDSQDYDQIAYNQPKYLPVFAAGNDRGYAPSQQPMTHWVYDPSVGNWVKSNAIRDVDGGTSGYDSLPAGPQTSKNLLVVGSCNPISGGYKNPSDVVMASYSSAGPTDDGRIKPDLVAPGQNIYTTMDNNVYGTISGTSIAAPVVTGAIGLIDQEFKQTHGGALPLSSTVRALLIHTADQAGSSVGPSYNFGWGLVNTKRAALTLAGDASTYGTVSENTLNSGQVFKQTVVSDGTTPLKVTIAWTDPAGTPTAPALNPTTPMLVNDLDLRVQTVGGTTYYPFVLDPTNPSAPATVGDNYRDNVEQVYIPAPQPGAYTISITAKNALKPSGSQNFSMVVTGVAQPQIASVSLNASSVTGGFATNPTGTVTLGAPAPYGGAVVNLSSSNSSVAVPASITVPAGATTANFATTASWVTANASATITAATASASATTTLTDLAPTYNATYVSSAFPSSVTAGQTFTATFTYTNTGTGSWVNGNVPGGYSSYALQTQNAYDNTVWGTNRMNLPDGVTVAPGQSYTFTATLTAPSAAGTYNLQWEPRKQGTGGATFGQMSPTANITVNGVPNAAFVSQSVPTNVAPGATFTVSFTFTNTGSTTWVNGNVPGGYSSYALQSQNAYDNTVWGANRINLPDGVSVAPGQSYTFTGTMTAPTTPGTYNMQWGLRRQGTNGSNYGQLNPATNIVVGS